MMLKRAFQTYANKTFFYEYDITIICLKIVCVYRYNTKYITWGNMHSVLS